MKLDECSIKELQALSDKIDRSRVSFLTLTYMRVAENSPELAEKLCAKLDVTVIAVFEKVIMLIREWNNSAMRREILEQLIKFGFQYNLTINDAVVVKDAVLWTLQIMFPRDSSLAFQEHIQQLFKELKHYAHSKITFTIEQ